MNDIGKKGEFKAAAYIESKGFEVISQNFKTRYGEIDIIARNHDYLLFIEVKTRGKNAIGLPKEAVDSRKQNKIIKTALLFLSENAFSLQPRFDVIEIYDYHGKGEIKHIKNAFTMEAYHESY